MGQDLTHAIECLAVHWPSDRLINGYADGTLQLWDVDHGECISNMAGHTENVSCVAIDEKSGQALSGSGDGTLRLWSTHRAACTATMLGAGQVVCLTVDWD